MYYLVEKSQSFVKCTSIFTQRLKLTYVSQMEMLYSRFKTETLNELLCLTLSLV